MSNPLNGRLVKRPACRLMSCLFTLALALSSSAMAELSIARGSQSGSVTQATNTAAAEWVYTLRPGESFPEALQGLLAPAYTTQQLAAYNHLRSPTELAPGDSLKIPMAWLAHQPEPATVVGVTGQGQVQHFGTTRREPLRPQQRLGVGDQVFIQQGNATIRLADESVIHLDAATHMVFNRLTQFGRTGMVDTRLRLERGTLSTEVTPLVNQGARFEIETPSAIAAVRGTAFALQAQPGETHLQVTKGVVAFGPPGQTRQIPAGYSATVLTRGAGSLEIRKLPPAPQTSPLAASIGRLPATLSWANDGAQLHQIDVYDKSTGHRVMSEQTNANDFALNYLDNGSYDVQVAALNSRGVTGMPSKQSVDIALQASAATNLSPANDARVDDDMPEFRWQYQGNNEVGHIEIAETDNFADVIATSEWAPDNTALPSRPLSPGQYYWRVVTEAGGNSVATSTPVRFVINGTLPPARIINVNYIDSQVRIFWQSVDTAKNYRLQLSEDPSFENIVKEATVSGTTAALRLIPGRRYFVRLKALSEGPLASRWGPGRELFID